MTEAKALTVADDACDGFIVAYLAEALARLRDAERALQRDGQLKPFYQRVLYDLMLLVEARYVALGLFDSDGKLDDFLTLGVTEAVSHRIGHLPEGKGVLEAFYRAGKTVRIDDIAAHPASIGFPPGHPPMKSLMGGPLNVEGQIRGVIYLADRRGGEPFGAAEETVLNLFIVEIQHALERNELFARLQEARAFQERQLDALAEANVRLLTVHEAVQMLDVSSNRKDTPGDATLHERVLFEAMNLVGARDGVLALFDDAGKIASALSRGVDPGEAERIGQWLQDNGMLQSLGKEENVRRIESPAEGYPGAGGLIGMPLRIGAHACGGIFLADKQGAAFGDHDEAALALFANEIAPVLERHALVKKLEEARGQLMQSEKLASIGQLAAGVAHEINNPIGYINSNLGSLGNYVNDLIGMVEVYQVAEEALECHPQLLDFVRQTRDKLDLEYVKQDIRDLVRESREGIDRVKKIVQDLKDFSRTGAAEWEWADLHKGLDSTLNIVWNEIKYKAEVAKNYGELPPVQCIPSQLNQVFMNLLVNAAHAIESRGTITLHTSAEDGWVRVRISDTGCGMSPEVMARIFDPFFTTKPVGKGTGLGLSLAYGIVERHGGRIRVKSWPGEGSVFTVEIPVQQPVKGDEE